MKIYLSTILSLFLLFTLAQNSVQAEESSMKLFSTPNTLTVSKNGDPVLVYKYKEVPFKPYVRELYSPKGFNVLLDAPPDHLHHHGLMFAVSVDGTSFWEETKTGGKENHKNFSGMNVTPNQIKFQETLDWTVPEGTHVLNEKRTVEVLNHDDTTLVRWTSMISVPKDKEKAAISGSHYYGLGMRFAESMDKIGKFVNSAGKEGKIFRGEERLTDAHWCAYEVTAEDHPITVVMMDTPGNFKQATWFTMPVPFAYLSATLRYHENPFDLITNKPVSLTYGVAVKDEIMSKDEIQNLYQDWLKINK